MMIVPLKIVLLLSLLTSYPLSASDIAIKFTESVLSKCPNLSQNLSKKLLVHFLMAEKAGKQLCDQYNQEIINNKCGTAFSCSDAEKTYIVLKQKERGSIIGE